MLVVCVFFDAVLSNWLVNNLDFPVFHHECRFERVDDNDVLQWMQNRHLVFIGDSVSRYMYLNFVNFIENDGAFVTKFENSRVHSISNEQTWTSWKEFYLGTTAMLRGHERCDCFRGQMAHWATDNEIHENRYYSNKKRNVNVTYVQFFHHRDIVAHLPIGFVDGAHLTEQNYGYRPFDFREPFTVAIQHILASLTRADVVVVNSGAWSWALEKTEDARIGELLDCVEAAVDENTTLIWRTTTMPFFCDKLVRTQLRSRPRWHVLDANVIVNELRNSTKVAWDSHVHLLSFAYEELIRLLLGFLIGQCRQLK